MKTMKIRYWASAIYLLVLLCVTCMCTHLPKEEELLHTQGRTLFYGVTPSVETAPKTYIDSDAQMYWEGGELLSVFRSTVNETFCNIAEAGSKKAIFQKYDSTLPGEEYGHNYAFYPWASDVSSPAEGTITFSFPGLQPYAEDSFSSGINPMVAVTESSADNEFKFSNLCSFLVFRLYGTARVRRIVFQGNNNEVLCGLASVNVESGETPVMHLSEEGGKQLILDCGEEGVPLGLDKESYTSFWLVIPPMTFSKGFSIEIESTCGTVTTRSTDSVVSVGQGCAQPMNEFEVNLNGIDMLGFSLSDGDNKYPAFNISNGYINVLVPHGVDMTNLTAFFNYSGVDITVDGIKQTSGVQSRDYSNFSDWVQFVITGSSGETQTYTVRLFDIPVVVLNTPSPITSKENWTSGCSMVIYEGGRKATDYGEIEVKGRGNSTWEYPKKPYALKLGKKAEVLKMPSHKRWVLLANWMDRTLLRNEFAFKIARQTNLAWTPRGQYVEVIMNGEHIGNYYLCEQIRVDKNRVNIDEMKASHTSGDKLTGGYLMEIDMLFDEVNKFRSGIRNLPYMFKEPDEDVLQPAQKTYFQTYVDSMEESLYAETWNETRDYMSYLDIDSFIDYWFVYELAMNHEPTNPKSCYIHKPRLGKLTAGPVWDFDWGTFLPARAGSFQVKTGLYYEQLFNDPLFRETVKERWDMFKPAFESIPAYIRELAENLSFSNAMNHAMWPLSEHPYGETNQDGDLDYDVSIDRIVSAYENKLNWMDQEISKMVTNTLE